MNFVDWVWFKVFIIFLADFLCFYVEVINILGDHTNLLAPSR